MLDTTDPSAGETLKSGAALRWFLKRVEELEIAGVCGSRRYSFPGSDLTYSTVAAPRYH